MTLSLDCLLLVCPQVFIRQAREILNRYSLLFNYYVELFSDSCIFMALHRRYLVYNCVSSVRYHLIDLMCNYVSSVRSFRLMFCNS